MALWDAIADAGTMVGFEAGAVLVSHGDTGTHCYAIIDGEVAVTVTTRQGSTVALRREGPGAVIGDLAALDSGSRTATVIARSPVRAVALTGPEFQSLLLQNPELALVELRRLAARQERLHPDTRVAVVVAPYASCNVTSNEVSPVVSPADTVNVPSC